MRGESFNHSKRKKKGDNFKKQKSKTNTKHKWNKETEAKPTILIGK